ncbi:unnamed protein product, partial [Didymodactylos carnosus]
GQYVTVDELRLLQTNIGGFISFKTFFSTSTSNVRALRRTGDGQGRPYQESVLFEIRFDKSTSTRFAKVLLIKEEEILLFSPGTVFLLKSIEKLNERVWYCQLSVSEEDECELIKMFEHFENEVGTPITFLSLGIYLSELKKNDMAIKYYEILLMASTNPDISSTIHNNLAIVYGQKNDPTNALIHLQKARELHKSD